MMPQARDLCVQPLLGDRRLSAREQLAEIMQSLASETEPELAARLPMRAFFEPRLFCQMAQTDVLTAMPLGQLVLSTLDPPAGTAVVRTDENGIVHIPGMGRCATDHPDAPLTLTYDSAHRTMTARHESADGSTDVRAEFTAGTFVPGTGIEIVTHIDPVLERFLEQHIDAPVPREASVPAEAIGQISRALQLIELADPEYCRALLESVRSVFMFDHPNAESFAALGMHGMVFLNVHEGTGIDYFVAELTHQGGHVFFSEATLARGDFFCLDPDTPLAELIGRDDPRTLYDAFHGLFTEHMEHRIVSLLLDRDDATEDERIDLTDHLATVTRLHSRDLELIGSHATAIFSEEGSAVFERFRAAFDDAEASRSELLGRAR